MKSRADKTVIPSAFLGIFLALCLTLLAPTAFADSAEKSNKNAAASSASAKQSAPSLSTSNATASKTKPKSERTLANGVYVIESLSASSQAIDVVGASPKIGANVQSYQTNGTTAQRWHVEWTKDGYYTLTSVESGRVLEVAMGSREAGANIRQYSFNGSDAQKWAIAKNKDGSYTITNKKSGMNLAVAGTKAKNGANIQTARPGGAKTQKFNFLRRAVLADGIYVLHPKTAQTSKALDIAGASLAQNAKAWVYDYNGTTAQRFVFKHLGNSVFSIQSVASGKYLADAKGKLVQQAFKGGHPL